ncbi:PREDICTED: uncharacterized protein LOC105128995 [Populus euphratica]|uniref:Uncharacterized protein LOC105128995 n=1 Tax=Populus euphratica TaxID=75702 RepID=A0AAJ6UGA0_POPEU|nr:PREDICTED: uncharacterized protein LOC105128995 [Populus euphratica]
MASSSSSSKQKSFPIERSKPLMLKDYLLDDQSSCSSNGFKSFPRRRCCTTVRLLLEIDLKTKQQQQQPRQIFKRSKSKAASTTISALQKASVAVMKAVKLLPFPSPNSTLRSPPPSRTRKGLLPRSISRKLFKKNFWRKAADQHGQCRESNEIRGWRLFGEFLEEQDKLSDQITSGISTSFSSNSNCNCNIWTTESEYTVDSGNSTCNSCRNDSVCNRKDLIIKEVSDGVSVSGGQDSITNRKEWPNEEEKEQSSPVSILDCPFQDEEEEIGSPFQRSLIRVEGTKQKLMQTIRRFESLAQIDPLDLEKRIAMAELEDESPVQHCSVSIHGDNENDFKETKENGTEKHAQELLKHVKSTISLASEADSTLLLDFFKEKIVENNAVGSMVGSYKEFEQELRVAQEWIDGQPKEMSLGWEMVERRHVYVKDMEKSGKWENVDQGKEEVALELEVQVFNSLVDEFLLDYILLN